MLRSAGAALMLMLCGAARAQLGATLSVESDYRFRGVSLSDSRPVGRITLNDDFASGAYAGASATRAQLSRGERYAQLIGYAGYATRRDEGRSLDFGITLSHFAGNSSYDYGEAYAGLLAERWSVRLHYSPNYFGRHVQTAYVDLSARQPISDGVHVFAHAGALVPLAGDIADPQGRRTRTDVRVGAGLSLGRVDLQLAAVGTSRGGPYPAVYDGKRGTWLLSALVSF